MADTLMTLGIVQYGLAAGEALHVSKLYITLIYGRVFGCLL